MGCPSGEKLSAWLDGDLSAGEAATVRAHAASCGRCSAALAELAALVSAAGQLDSLEVPPTLWRGIEGALERQPEPAPPARTWFGRLAWRAFGREPSEGSRTLPRDTSLGKPSSVRAFAVGALVGSFAMAALLFPAASRKLAARPTPPAVAGPMATAPVDPLLEEAEAEFASAAAAYERSIEKLRGLLDRAEQGWSPAERARTAERLARLDEAIERSRDFARRTPGDSAGNEQLFAAYQQKIAFLAAAVHRGNEWNEPDPQGAR
jgi:hypothetical protein